MSFREGRPARASTFLIPNVPWVAQQNELEAIIRIASGGTVLETRMLEDHPRSVNGVTKVAFITLNTNKAKDRLKAKSRKGHLFLAKKVLIIEEDAEAIPEGMRAIADPAGIDYEGSIKYWATSVVPMIVSDGRELTPLGFEIDRAELILVEFDFPNSKIVWGYPDPTPFSGVCYCFELPFSSIASPGCDFWKSRLRYEGINDIYMGVRLQRLPRVSYFDLVGGDQHVRRSPFDNDEAALNKLAGRRGDLIAEMNVRFHSGRSQGSSCSPSVYFASYDDSPLQECDYLVFFFRNRADSVIKSKLFDQLRAHGLAGKEARFVDRIRPPHVLPYDSSDGDEYTGLPFPIRWRLSALRSHLVISSRACRARLIPKIRAYLERGNPVTKISAALDLLIQRRSSYLPEGVEAWKIGDSRVQEKLLQSLEWVNEMKLQSELETEVAEGLAQLDCALVSEIIVTPSKLYCSGPYVHRMNRMLRYFKKETADGAFAVVRFMREDLRPLHLTDLEHVEDDASNVRSALQNGLCFYGEMYEFVMFSFDTSGELVCWFLNSNLSSTSAEEVRNWMGEYKHFKSVVRCTRIFSLALAPSFGPPVTISESEWVVSLDERKHTQPIYGLISPWFATELCEKTGLPCIPVEPQTWPSCIEVQFRDERRILVQYPLPNMLKVVFPSRGITSQPTSESDLEVCGGSYFCPGALSFRTIMLLHELGVEESVFAKLQKDHIRRMMTMERSRETALDTLRSEMLDVPGEVQQSLARVLAAGAPMNDPFLREIIVAIQECELKMMRTTGRIPVPLSGVFYWIEDPTKTLEPGQASLIVRRKDRRGEYTKHIVGDSMVVFHRLSLQLQDVFIFDAVDPPSALTHLENVLVYSPTAEMKKHVPPSMWYSSDWDVEKVTVFWDPDLIPSVRPPTARLPYYMREQTLEQTVCLQDIHNFVIQAFNSVRSEVAMNNFMAWADKDSMQSSSCKRLQAQVKQADTFSLSGAPTELPLDLQLRDFPDFLAQENKVSKYVSPKVVGKLYRHATEVLAKKGHEMTEPRAIPSMLVPGYETFLPEAKTLCAKYTFEIEKLMSSFGAGDSEAKLFARCIPDHRVFSTGPDLRSRLDLSLEVLQGRFRRIFFATNDARTSLTSRMQKISAWYVAAQFPDHQLRTAQSFPWVVPSALADLYQFAHAQSGTKRARVD